MSDIVDGHIRAAVALGKARRFTEAKAMLDDLQALNPGHSGITTAFGVLAIEMGDADQAVRIFGAQTSRDPGNAELCANLAAAYRLAGRREEAEASIERALMLSPDTARFWLLRAELMIEGRDGAGALEAVERALRLAAGDPAVHRGAGLVLVALGLHEGAERAFRHALSLDPEDVATLHNLASLLALLGRHEEALSLAERAFLASPTDVDLTRTYASRLAEVGRLDEAARTVRRLVAVLPDDIETVELLASLQIRRGELADGLAIIGALVRRQPRAPAALAALGRILLASDRAADALVAADQALALDAADEPARILQRSALLSLGRFDEALPAVPDTAVGAELVIDPQSDLIETVIALRWHGLLGDESAAIRGEGPHLALFCQLTGRRAAEPAAPPPARVVTPAILMRRGLTDDAGPAAPWPYLVAHDEQLAPWTAALAEFRAPRLGLVWHKASPGFTLDLMREALPPGMTPVSLAIGSARRQLRAWPEALDGGAQIGGPTDLVGALGSLDGIVAVDGIALHLAGAMGRPGIAVMPVGSPWYWLEEDGRARFYPSLRILRQASPGRWDREVALLRDLIAELWDAAPPAAAAAPTALPIGDAAAAS
jgi:tetratricopeptide (TPR) repeat protein